MSKLQPTRKISLAEWLVVIPWTPLIGLGLFFFLPWEWALPIYLVASIVTVFLAWKSWQAIRRPIASGVEAMIGAVGEALTDIEKQGQVRYRGEIWSARTATQELIAQGEPVVIIKLEGLRLVVEKVSKNEQV